MNPTLKNNDLINKGWLICALGAVFYCYEYILRIEPSLMVPELMQYFKLSADKFGILVSLYYLAYAPMQFFVGVILDIYKPKYILTLAVSICVTGSALFALTDQVIICALGRFLIGLGSAFAFIGALKLATIFLPRNKFAFFSGLVTSFGMLGGFVANLLFGTVIKMLGWKMLLILSTVIGMLIIPSMWHFLSMEIFKKSNASNPRSQELLKPILKIIKNKNLWKIGLTGSLLFLSISVFAELWGITFIRTHFHLDNQHAAFINALIFLGWMIGAPLNGVFSEKFTNKANYLIFGGLAGTLLFSLIVFSPIHSILSLEILFFLLGLVSSTQTLCFVIAREYTSNNLTATTLAFINIVVMLGGLLFQPFIGLLLHYFPVKLYSLVFAIFPISFIVSAYLASSIKTREKSVCVTNQYRFDDYIQSRFLIQN